MNQLATVPKSNKAFRKGSMIKVLPFQNMFIPEKVDRATGVYFYGKDNKLPNKLMSWVLDSGTAKKAQSKRANYISADGFTNKASGEFKVNPNQSADQLLNEIAGYQSFFKGFALRVKRNLTSTEFRVDCLAFQDIRKKEDGTFTYNPSLSSNKFDKKKEVILHPFKRELNTEEMQQRIEHGELVYAYNKSADNSYYPIPDYYAGIEDIRSSSELQKFDFETVMNAFVTSAILTLIGEKDDITKDESGMTELDYFMEELEKFTGNVKDSDGVSGRMRMLIMTARNKDEVPVLTPFDAKVIVDASNTKREIIDRSVCRLFGVHPVLIGFSDAAVLGNTQAIANASQELNNDVIPDQRLIAEVFNLIYQDKDWTVSSFRPIQYVPDAFLSVLTESEKRQLIGFPELEQQTTSERMLADVLGVGGTQSLVAIISDPLLSREQKKATLEILFGITTEDADRLVGDATPPIIPTA